MLSNKIINTVCKTVSMNPAYFSTVKKKQMEVTLRTPYRNLLTYIETYLQNFSGFSRISTKNLSSVVVVQNRTPAVTHVLPPGNIKIKFTQ